ncbi:hypothetical protein VIGAN_07176800, partial [Vigna angularis var. angularis]
MTYNSTNSFAINILTKYNATNFIITSFTRLSQSNIDSYKASRSTQLISLNQNTIITKLFISITTKLSYHHSNHQSYLK